MKLNQHRTGLALGSFVALIHLIWSVMLALGWAKPWIDFKMSLHSIEMPYTLMDFSLGRSVMLIIVAFVAGYVLGQIFSAIWNKIQK